jgi:hypothetical protein
MQSGRQRPIAGQNYRILRWLRATDAATSNACSKAGEILNAGIAKLRD